MRTINAIIVHCSDSPWGDFDAIDSWHKEKGWSGCGYHALILNGWAKNSREYDPSSNGLIVPGRPLERTGAHCYGHNKDSLGICLIGVDEFTPEQYYSLRQMIDTWRQLYLVSDGMIRGHRDFQQTSGGKRKTCPNFDVREWFFGKAAA